MAPPKTAPRKECSKQMAASCYIWSEEAAINFARVMARCNCSGIMTSIFLGLEVERMTTLATKPGTIPRILLRYIHLEDWMVEIWNRAGIDQAVRE